MRHNLSNMLTLITTPMSGTRAVAIVVMVKTGSRYEEKETSGVSHFLEHMCFKGCRQFPKSTEVSRMLDRMGADFNAFTEIDRTWYFIVTKADKVKSALDIITSMTIEPRFPKDEFEMERKVILEEIRSEEDEPEWILQNLWHKLVYDPNPLALPIGGSIKSISALRHKQMVDWWRTYYSGTNIIVSIAGDIDEQIERQAVRQFTKIQIGPRRHLEHFRNNQNGFQTSLKTKRLEQTHFTVGVTTGGCSQEVRRAINVLSVVLGGSQSSRLFEQVRDREGLAYLIGAETAFLPDTGVFRVNTSTSPHQAPKALKAILKETEKIVDKGVTREEVDRAKEMMIGEFIRSLERAKDMALWKATYQFDYGLDHDPDVVIMMNRAVTPKEVHEAAKLIFDSRNLNFVAVGPDVMKHNWDRILRSV